MLDGGTEITQCVTVTYIGMVWPLECFKPLLNILTCGPLRHQGLVAYRDPYAEEPRFH